MEDNRYRKFYVDWWNIRRSTIYGSIAIVLFVGLIAGGTWYASLNNWFQAVENGEAPKDAARIVSFEGEVRITRAATRETILVTRATYVTAGDTIQRGRDKRSRIGSATASQVFEDFKKVVDPIGGLDNRWLRLDPLDRCFCRSKHPNGDDPQNDHAGQAVSP